ncbi:uncharacterized protein EI97DRAFT_442019 [Westerdykella ornata]|uniref:Uncharacterized protein n=1 Tax=Westerdykella ornata TaxID=318751 RepID=A0A6A6JJI1_WESOR|nr:uncharacterized protein EI97DRAFT_442019 [Westerdykella ornata]KAF2276622.1 hypothetical protein EI97DRAFT_442019 [Westerdykella ornata]
MPNGYIRLSKTQLGHILDFTREVKDAVWSLYHIHDVSEDGIKNYVEIWEQIHSAIHEDDEFYKDDDYKTPYDVLKILKPTAMNLLIYIRMLAAKADAECWTCNGRRLRAEAAVIEQSMKEMEEKINGDFGEFVTALWPPAK